MVLFTNSLVMVFPGAHNDTTKKSATRPTKPAYTCYPDHSRHVYTRLGPATIAPVSRHHFHLRRHSKAHRPAILPAQRVRLRRQTNRYLRAIVAAAHLSFTRRCTARNILRIAGRLRRNRHWTGYPLWLFVAPCRIFRFVAQPDLLPIRHLAHLSILLRCRHRLHFLLDHTAAQWTSQHQSAHPGRATLCIPH